MCSGGLDCPVVASRATSAIVAKAATVAADQRYLGRDPVPEGDQEAIRVDRGWSHAGTGRTHRGVMAQDERMLGQPDDGLVGDATPSRVCALPASPCDRWRAEAPDCPECPTADRTVVRIAVVRSGPRMRCGHEGGHASRDEQARSRTTVLRFVGRSLPAPPR